MLLGVVIISGLVALPSPRATPHRPPRPAASWPVRRASTWWSTESTTSSPAWTTSAWTTSACATSAGSRPSPAFRTPGSRSPPAPVAALCSPEHHLNRGFLQRSVEHANGCHQEELRRAVSTTSGTRLSDVVGVTLTGLTPRQVEVQWVDLRGSPSQVLVFRPAARNTEELGELLRRELHAGLC
jgi:hypothetical protein